MEFKKYQHVARYGDTVVTGIDKGTVYVFPKIDGTNTSAWLGTYTIRCGARNRELTIDYDHMEFYKTLLKDERIARYLEAHPNHRIFGEWLVPHTLKIYNDNAWNKFYIFDVCVDREDGALGYLSYKEYSKLLDEFELDYIEPIAVLENPTYDDLTNLLESNKFLVKDENAVGEGIVLKNYEYSNKYDRQRWAKIVTSEFKKEHKRVFGEGGEVPIIEQQIVDKFVTEAFIEKEYAKLLNNEGQWSTKLIPQLFNRIFYELINEEMWNILKHFKNPTINFKTLNSIMTKKIKEVKADLF